MKITSKEQYGEMVKLESPDSHYVKNSLLAFLFGGAICTPITGFANSVVSSAIEFRSEGFVMGLGAKIFNIAGPVLVYGISSSILYGLILYIVKLVQGG